MTGLEGEAESQVDGDGSGLVVVAQRKRVGCGSEAVSGMRGGGSGCGGVLEERGE